MLKFVVLGAVAAASVIAVAAPAAAAEHVTEVRIDVVGKTYGQLDGEIRAAAAAVCGAVDELCVSAAVDDGLRQLHLINRAHRTAAPVAEQPRIQLMQGGVYAMRVSLKDKTDRQIQAEIQAAARAVCKPVALGRQELTACVDGAIRNAQDRLHAVQAENAKVREFASN